MRKLLLSAFAALCLCVAGCAADPADEKEKRGKAVVALLETLVKREIGYNRSFTVLSQELEETPEAVHAAITYSYKNRLELVTEGSARMALCSLTDFAHVAVPDMTDSQRAYYEEFRNSNVTGLQCRHAAVSYLAIGEHVFSAKELEHLTTIVHTPPDFPNSAFELILPLAHYNRFASMRESARVTRLIAQRIGRLETWLESRKKVLGGFSYSLHQDQDIRAGRPVTTIVLTEAGAKVGNMETRELLDALCPPESDSFWRDGVTSDYIFLYAGSKELGHCGQVRK